MLNSPYLASLFSLEDKIVLITGAAGGIGSTLAQGLAGAGAVLALADLSEQPILDLIESLGEKQEADHAHAAFVLNVRDLASIDQCVRAVLDRFGRIDVLINCAGINQREGYLDVAEETYDRLMGVNLKGVFFLTQAVVRESMMKTGGKIINVASFTSTQAMGGNSVYGATKSGIAALTRSMAIEWAKFNIQANAIAPGHILTQLTQVTWANEHRAAYLRERIAAERPGLPEELIGITILLSSPASSYITGQLINIDGGALAGGKPWQFDTKY